MEIADDTVVHIHYTLKSETGELLDKSPSDAPLAYLHGHGNIIPGLETALSGSAAGDVLEVRVEAVEGYGERHPELVQSVPLGAFDGVSTIEPGMRFQAETEQGPRAVVVVEVAGDVVTVDGNHPLAGEALHFDVEVAAVRAATPEEISEGQVKG